MRKGILLLMVSALALTLAAPALAQPGSGKGPQIDRAKAYLVEQEFIAATGEARGKLMAKRAELETVLATKADDAAAIKKVVDEISALRTTLLEQTVQFRLRLSKEAGVPIAFTRRMGLFRQGPPRGLRTPRGQHHMYQGHMMDDEGPEPAVDRKSVV
jgi:hypothetical protein